MQAVAEQLRQHLKKYPEVFDIQDSHSDGKEEYQITLAKQAQNLGLTQRDIAVQLRQAIFGYEAQRIQRNRDEVKVTLRYPAEYRASLEDLKSLPITNRQGQTIQLAEVADIKPGVSPTAFYRINRERTLTISADLNKKTADIEAIKRETAELLDSLLQQYPDINYELEGEAKEQAEAVGSLVFGGLAVLLAIYTLLAIPFKSYWQPFIVMSVIPLGFVGAALGHMIMGANLSLLSFMGLLALTGVVVNDSLVLVDYINKQRLRGHDMMDAVLTAGAARFRPVMLTSLTTFAGLIPILLEKSTQAQFLQPMAISLGFGILFATLITLIIIPVNYIVFHNIGKGAKQTARMMFMKPVKRLE